MSKTSNKRRSKFFHSSLATERRLGLADHDKFVVASEDA